MASSKLPAIFFPKISFLIIPFTRSVMAFSFGSPQGQTKEYTERKGLHLLFKPGTSSEHSCRTPQYHVLPTKWKEPLEELPRKAPMTA